MCVCVCVCVNVAEKLNCKKTSWPFLGDGEGGTQLGFGSGGATQGLPIQLGSPLIIYIY